MQSLATRMDEVSIAILGSVCLFNCVNTRVSINRAITLSIIYNRKSTKDSTTDETLTDIRPNGRENWRLRWI